MKGSSIQPERAWQVAHDQYGCCAFLIFFFFFVFFVLFVFFVSLVVKSHHIQLDLLSKSTLL